MRIRLTILLVVLGTLAWSYELPQGSNVPLISVSITGFVERPGVYQVTPFNRLSDVLPLSSMPVQSQAKGYPAITAEEKASSASSVPVPDVGAEEKASSATPDYHKLQALRTIQLIREGKSQIYDLQKFYRLGDISQNPLLRDGDVVLISAVQSFVYVNGAVNLPGEIEFVPGDKLSDLIALAKGLSYDADTGQVQVYRFKENMVDFEISRLSLLDDSQTGTSAYGYSLRALDRIVVPRAIEITRKSRVFVSGQVQNPGEYIIGSDTTLYDMIGNAGGLTARADIQTMVCYNEYLNAKANPLLEVLMQRSMSDMTPLEYSFLRSNLQQLKGKYSIDPKRIWESEGKEANLVLHDGDRIYIPEKMDMVWVSGQVRHPGLVPWVEGKNWDHYVQAAGGYANNRKAGKSRLIRGYSGNWVKPKKNIAIMPGDTVFVPEQTDRSLWTDVKDIVTLASSAITIIVGLRALSN